VTANWADANQTKISVKATTTFVENMSNANYSIGYVLAEDGLSGTTSNWYQTNYYAGSSLKDPNLINLTSGESKITNVVYNYIPVAAYEPFDGIEGSVPATITKDVAMNHSYTFDINGNPRIQNKQKLSVVALLINKDDGKIVNAAKFKFNQESDAQAGFQFLSSFDGDANDDGVVNIADIVEMVNSMNGKSTSNKFNLEKADYNIDGKITDVDIDAVMKIIMGK